MFSERNETKCVVKIGTWSEREKSKVVLREETFFGKHGSFEVGVKSSGRERVSLIINCTRYVVDLSKVSRISLRVG